jgi:UDPglucose 6-dehydrogenase
MRYVDDAVSDLAPHLHRPCLVVGKSTVPVGTAARLTGLLQALAPRISRLSSREPGVPQDGFAVQDTLSPDRVVVGVSSMDDDETLRELNAPVLRPGMPTTGPGRAARRR